jgi:hypothetical protein
LRETVPFKFINWDGDAEFTVEPLVPGDTVEALSDVVNICIDSSELVDGLHYLSKRTNYFLNNAISK